MEKLAATLLIELHQLTPHVSSRDFLRHVATILHKTAETSHLIAYELIAETGGVPRLPAVCVGEFLQPKTAESALADTTHRGALSELIRTWQPHFESDAPTWAKHHPHPQKMADFAHFVHAEQIQSFAFLPVLADNQKTAVLLLTYRQPRTWETREQQILTAATALIHNHLLRLQQQSGAALIQKNRMATAHTRYGEVALLFKGQIDSLKVGLRTALGNQIPSQLATHLETAEHTVFEAMRNLVIEASGDMLVNLETMPLAKALNTVAAALLRAWPPDVRMIIEVPPVPLVIERQSLPLRQMVYTLILEAIGNAIKHGGPAPYIHVDVTWEDNQIFIQVIDHGKGFDLKTHPFSQHGLGFWQQYIMEHLTGDFHVSSQPGYGTVVNACIPVIPARVEHDVKKFGI